MILLLGRAKRLVGLLNCLDGRFRYQQNCLYCRRDEKNESAAFWMSILTDMKARGVNDILITVTNNLNSFTATIRTVFLELKIQICIVHHL